MNTNKKWLKNGMIILLAASAPLMGVASDEAQSTANVSLKSLRDRLSATYFGIYAGPSLGSLDSKYMVDPSTGQLDPGSPQDLANQFKVNYDLTDQVIIGPILNFHLKPFTYPTAQISDSGVRIGHKKLMSAGDFNLFADARLMAPISQKSIDKHVLVTPQSLMNATYSVPKSKWSLGLIAFHQFPLYSSGGSGKDADFYYGPNVNYEFSKSLSGTLVVEANLIHKPGEWKLAAPIDVSPGVVWNITENFSINPSLLIYPSNLTLSATGTVMYISGKLL